MSKEEQVRFIFVRDDEKTRTGFATPEAANAHADTIVPRDANGSRDGVVQRVRVRLRNRTGLWDVLVKTRREVKPQQKDAP